MHFSTVLCLNFFPLALFHIIHGTDDRCLILSSFNSLTQSNDFKNYNLFAKDCESHKRFFICKPAPGVGQIVSRDFGVWFQADGQEVVLYYQASAYRVRAETICYAKFAGGLLEINDVETLNEIEDALASRSYSVSRISPLGEFWVGGHTTSAHNELVQMTQSVQGERCLILTSYVANINTVDWQNYKMFAKNCDDFKRYFICEADISSATFSSEIRIDFTSGRSAFLYYGTSPKHRDQAEESCSNIYDGAGLFEVKSKSELKDLQERLSSIKFQLSRISPLGEFWVGGHTDVSHHGLVMELEGSPPGGRNNNMVLGAEANKCLILSSYESNINTNDWKNYKLFSKTCEDAKRYFICAAEVSKSLSYELWIKFYSGQNAVLYYGTVPKYRDQAEQICRQRYNGGSLFEVKSKTELEQLQDRLSSIKQELSRISPLGEFWVGGHTAVPHNLLVMGLEGSTSGENNQNTAVNNDEYNKITQVILENEGGA